MGRDVDVRACSLPLCPGTACFSGDIYTLPNLISNALYSFISQWMEGGLVGAVGLNVRHPAVKVPDSALVPASPLPHKMAAKPASEKTRKQRRVGCHNAEVSH